jgi:hypothetical protein
MIPNSKGATVFVLLWEQFKKVTYDDEFATAPKPIPNAF